MHVLLVTQRWTDRGYGGEFSVDLLAKTLRAEGDTVTVAARDVDGDGGDAVVETGSARGIAGIARNRDVDVLHCYNNQLQSAALLGSRLTGVPAVATANSYWPTCLFGDMTFPDGELCRGCSVSGVRRDYRTRHPESVGTRVPSPLGRLEVARRTWVLSRFDRIVALSAASADQLARGGVARDRIDVVPNMVDPDDLEADVPPVPDDPVVAFVGKLTHAKGVHVLVDAFVRVRDRVPDAELVLAGDGVQMDELERRIDQLGLAGAVDLRGRIPPDHVRDLYRDARVLAFPVIWHEPFGRVILEAWAHGTPVVTTTRGGPGEVVTDGKSGRIVPPGAPRRLADALVDVLRDDALARRLREGGHAALDAYRPERIVDRYVELYEDLLG